MKTKLFLTSLVAMMVLAVSPSWACTNLIVGKAASVDGSVICTYNCDGYGFAGSLSRTSGGRHEKGEKIAIREWGRGAVRGYIPQVEYTYDVIGHINEKQVSIVETTFDGRLELQNPEGLLDYFTMMYLGLERAATARGAIIIMTDLLQEYGYCSTGETITVCDKNEAWILEIIGKGPGVKGAVWVAVRIPDDCICAHANLSRIRQFPLRDPKNCMYSKDVISFARKKGLFDGKDEDFAFAPVYQKFDAGALRGCDARVWSYFNRFHKGMDAYLPFIYGKTRQDADVMPLYVKPDRKVSVRDMQEMMRDHFEGTPFDMTVDPGATTAYGVPYRWRPMDFEVDGVTYSQERAIATQQTGWVFAAQMRSWMPDEVGGCFWFGVDDANTAVFVPMYCCITQVPESYRQGKADMYTLDWDCAFWVNNWVANQAYARYSQMIGDIRKVQGAIEDGFAKQQSVIEAQATSLLTTDRAAAIRLLTNYSVNAGQDATARYRKLGEYLFVKYLDGNIKKEKDGKFQRNEYGTPASPTFAGYNQEYYDMLIKGPNGGDRLKVVEPEWLPKK